MIDISTYKKLDLEADELTEIIGYLSQAEHASTNEADRDTIANIKDIFTKRLNEIEPQIDAFDKADMAYAQVEYRRDAM